MDTNMMQYQRGPSFATGSGGANDIASACYANAIDLADREQTPVAIWHRDGWHCVSDVAPDIDEDDTRETDGWQIVAVLAPEEDTRG